MSLRVRFIESEIKFEDFMIFCYGKVNDFGFSSIGVNAKNVRNAEKASICEYGRERSRCK